MTATCGKESGWCKGCPNWPKDPWKRALAECDAAEAAYRKQSRFSLRALWRLWVWGRKVRALDAFDLGVAPDPPAEGVPLDETATPIHYEGDSQGKYGSEV